MPNTTDMSAATIGRHRWQSTCALELYLALLASSQSLQTTTQIELRLQNFHNIVEPDCVDAANKVLMFQKLPPGPPE